MNTVVLTAFTAPRIAGCQPQALARLAVASLHAELACDPKPGLVTPSSRGSHDDMDAGTFLRSLFALRHYFTAIACAGAADAPFKQLRQHGIRAEQAMLQATGGINTHRGAIFSLGLLTASAAALHRQGRAVVTADAVCQAVSQWRAPLFDAPLDPHSPGQRALRRHGITGVREQAAAGYPLLRRVALPALRASLQAGHAPAVARIQCLMALIATTDDLNLLHRGGAAGLAFAKTQARAFLDAGGVRAEDWHRRLQHMSEQFQARRLSPGGSADLMACAWFLHQQEAACHW